nr:MAG TPA: hypothetical protein [Caudoviricetes sp.]
MAKWIEDPQGRLEVEKVTEEIKLPVWKANYKGKFREFWNECWEKIEDNFLKLKKSNEGKEPAITTKETAFNKPFGVSEDTVLEGNKFTQMTGKDYGGILNIAGQKEAGKAYWDNNTKKLYICKNNNSDISPNINNYIPFDNGSILERLENLFKYSKIFDGRASIKGQVLGSIPDNSKFIELIGINYASDGNFYYFQPITLRTEIIRNRDIFFNLGITSDTREFGLSFKNNVISIIHSSYSNSTADNNFIGQILSVNS